MVFAFFQRLKQRGAQGRGEDHGDQHRQHHRRDNRDGELAVNRAGGAAEKRHRDKHRREHHRDAHQRALDLAHRFTRGGARRQPLFAHDALDVFHNYDGVIHQQAYRQHHREHRQGVNAVAEAVEHRESAEQHHGHGDSRDQRGAEILQKEVHHQEHQRDRFKQRFNHVGNRGFHERGGLIRDFIFQPVREIVRQFVEPVQHQLGRCHLVSAGGELHAKARGRFAVIAAQIIIFLGPHFDRRHIAERDGRPVLIHAKRNGAKLFRRLQQRLGINSGVQRLIIDRRRAAELADRYLAVLRFNRRHHIRRGELKAGEFVRVKPDAHGVLRAVGVDIPDAVDAAQRLLNITRHIVGDILFIHAAVGGDKRDGQDIGIAGFTHRHALRLYGLGELSQRGLQLILHLLDRFIRVGARFEIQRHGRLAGGAALRGHIHQVIEAGHILFDDLGDGVFQRLGGSARVVRRDTHVRRRQFGILLNRK
ncbi:hypothetical protein BN136_1469 [Cronobacter universalis NCTC 9529]|nr:hypothetical protein BN136_1469 [Cronobacter universalis NCTC 9529]